MFTYVRVVVVILLAILEFRVDQKLFILVDIDNPILNISETSKTLNETSTLHIKCSSVSLPFAKYRWFSANNTIVSETNVLLFGTNIFV